MSPKRKVRSLDDLPSRYQPEEPGPSFLKQWGLRVVIVLLLATLGTVLYGLWERMGAGPARTIASPAGRAPVAAGVQAVLEAAKAQLAGGAPEQAERILRAGVDSYPEEQAIRVALAECLVARGLLPEAYEQYGEALRIGPADPVLEFAAGTIASAIGEQEAAVVHFIAAQAGDPSEPRYPLHLAQSQLRLEQYESAKASLLHVLKLSPEDPLASGMLADLFLRENSIGLALQHVATARRAQPEVGAWKVIEAKALKRQGKAEEALLLIQSLSEEERYTRQVLQLMGECCGMLGRINEAAEVYARASDARATDPGIAFDAAVWLDRAKDAARARAYAERARLLGHEGAEKLLERLASGGGG